MRREEDARDMLLSDYLDLKVGVVVVRNYKLDFSTRGVLETADGLVSPTWSVRLSIPRPSTEVAKYPFPSQLCGAYERRAPAKMLAQDIK
jgi:hypothetical protein